jgi:hypothetical protein
MTEIRLRKRFPFVMRCCGRAARWIQPILTGMTTLRPVISGLTKMENCFASRPFFLLSFRVSPAFQPFNFAGWLLLPKRATRDWAVAS